MNKTTNRVDASAGAKSVPPAFAWLNLGFRPFYLLASIFAVVAIALWTARFNGGLTAGNYLGNSLWHAHEMIFGYAVAVIVGFLFTAVRNWTSRPTPTGATLGAIVALWAMARLLLFVDLPWLSLAFDLTFALAAAWGIGRPLVASGNRRNQFFIVVLLAIGAANLVFSLAMAGHVPWSPRVMLTTALDLVLFVMVVVGGRVIPMFTANGAPSKPRRLPWLEQVVLASVLLLILVDLLALPGPVVALVAAVAAMAHGARLWLWQPWRTRRVPLLWILHASYLWIVVSLVLRAFAAVDMVALSLATHALTVGGIGGLTLGMMTRTARGHTGYPLVAGRIEVAAYALIQAAAVARVVLPLALSAHYLDAVNVSAILWAGAFALYAFKYGPMLWRPRIDGKPG